LTTRSSTYTLRRIASSKDPTLVEALAVYTAEIAPTFTTDTNEIVHWLDHYEETFGDSLLVFSLAVRRRIVGFAHMVYFRSEQIVVFDYLVIAQAYRKNNVFFEFVEQIREYFRARSWPVRWIAVEVALTYQPRPDAPAALLIRLLKLEGFRVAKAPYYSPLLNFHNLESEMAAVLLLSGDAGISRIKRETYLRIVTTIYYKHYLRWYSIYPTEEQKERARRISILERQIQDSLGHTKSVELNGHGLLMRPSSAGSENETSAERNLATNATRAAIPIILALAGGALPEPFRYALWGALVLGIVVALFIWPSSRLRRGLWKEIRLFRRRG
jgi:hypothetical protein